MRILICCCLLFAGCIGVNAKEIEGVMIQETIVTDDGAELRLNGSGVRSKFFFDIYVMALYMENPGDTVEKVVNSPGRKRIVMHFLYKKVEKEKLVEAWNEGFAGNLPADQLMKLQDQIDQFNAQFTDAVKGDVIILDYAPERGTTVYMNSEVKGTTPGKEFNDALLRIWLGENPGNKDLRAKLLAGI